MSDIAIAGRSKSAGPFSRKGILALVGAGLLAFVATLVLGAYAPDLRSGSNGGSHALSNAATGYSGLVRLAELTGRNPTVVRQDYLLDSEELLIISPGNQFVELGELLERRQAKATLLILPKWDAARDKEKPAWVRIRGLLPPEEPAGVLAPSQKLTIIRGRTVHPVLQRLPQVPDEMAFRAPRLLQAVKAGDLQPIVWHPAGPVVVGEVGQTRLYVLTDPDLLNNHGIADPGQARAALALIDYLMPTGTKGVQFDVTLNGLGGSRSPLRLAFDPPFLAVTIAIFVALLLAGLQAIYRFGPPCRPERALAFGKAALVDNSASLVRRAGREAQLASRYADAIRARAAALFRLSGSGDAQIIDGRLDELRPKHPFSSLARWAAETRNRNEALSAARGLHHWIEEIEA